MTEPLEVRNQQVESGSIPPPPAAGLPAEQPYSGTRTVDSRSSVLPVAYRTRQLIWISLAVVEAFLVLRFALVAFNAGDSAFTTIIYRVARALASPFQGAFGITNASGHPLEWVNVVAIVIYAVAGWIVAKLLLIAASPRRSATA
jgi:hypothetical protein